MAKLLEMWQLRGRKFVIEYRSKYLQQFGLKVCTPYYCNRTWRPWTEPPTKKEREAAVWNNLGTLCELCKNACGGCSWSDHFEPVPGWKANPETVKIYSSLAISTYHVNACPGFSPGRGRPREWHTDGFVRLMEAVMSQARADYVLYGSTYRDEIEHWLRQSPWLTDPDPVIKDLRDAARIYALHPEKKKELLRRMKDEHEAEPEKGERKDRRVRKGTGRYVRSTTSR